MMGVEIFRPMRDLRTVLHQGMLGYLLHMEYSRFLMQLLL
ncbi:MAG: hypothetical protein Ct9H300mP28_16880 [Pseudomonadota bacterium]|nr:MAG: hypothetical protein Ct9H300mP28_16880 [Pseudomonadota bacterium]